MQKFVENRSLCVMVGPSSNSNFSFIDEKCNEGIKKLKVYEVVNKTMLFINHDLLEAQSS